MRTQKNHPRLFGTGPGWVALLCLAVLAWTGIAAAQLPAPGTPWSFDIDGFLQEAKLDGAGSGVLQGGHLKVNGHVVTVPANTIVVLPGNQLTWQELFAQAPAPYLALGQTGMAANDGDPLVVGSAPLVQYEAHVIGNVLPSAGATPGSTCTILVCSGEYVAGLVYISQQATNSGTGYINFIDYANNELLVGGTPGDATTGTRVRLNDPTGQYGNATVAGTTDLRFSVGSFHTPTVTVAPGVVLDSNNPTVRSVTGFPMCLPRTAPVAGGGDALCPETQRPAGAGQITTADPLVGGSPSPFVQAPFEVGDYVSFAGTLVQDCALTGCPGGGPTAGPYPVPAIPPAKANTFISAHTVVSNIAIYTAPGTNPAYVAIDVALMGTGGNTVIGLTEAAIRTRFEGFTTDLGRNIHVYGVDLACNGTESANRDWGTIGVDPGPPTGAAKGRWRFRPPCTGVANTTTTLGTVTDKVCSPPAAGVFDPPPRDVRAVLELPANPLTAAPAVPAWVPGQTTQAAGVIYGQAHTPITEYIFPEQVAGAPPPPDNFETLAFLASGGVSSTTGVLAGTQLSPWPGVPAPASTCGVNTAPTVTASADVASVTAGGVVNLSAVATGTPAPTLTWAQTAGTAGTFSSTTGPAVAWTAPAVTVTEIATFTVTAANGVLPNATSSVSVTVNPSAAPTITSVTATPTTAIAGTVVALNATATGPNPITFTWAQTAGTAGTFSPIPPTGASVSWTAPSVTVTETATFTVTATDTVSLLSSSAPVSITVNPPVFPPTIAHVPPQTVNSGALVTMNVTATSTDPVFVTNLAAMLTLNVTTTPVITPINIAVPPVKTCTIAGCTFVWTVTFTAPTIPAGAPNTVISVTITATDTFVTPNLTSAPEFTTVTVTPPADTIGITSVEYRIGKQRLIINATSNVISPTDVLTLQPYQTQSGGTFTPSGTSGVFTNNGGGLYILTLVGAQPPACNLPLGGPQKYATPCALTPIVVKSSLGGTSPASKVTKIRQ